MRHTELKCTCDVFVKASFLFPSFWVTACRGVHGGRQAVDSVLATLDKAQQMGSIAPAALVTPHITIPGSSQVIAGALMWCDSSLQYSAFGAVIAIEYVM